jgi:predicted RNA-binding protein with PIN domain
LHSCPEIAPGKPRHSEAAREELIFLLTQYQDAAGTPVTIFFDGAGAPPTAPQAISTPEVEVLFSRAGRTADDLIERAAHRFKAYGEVLVVTDDSAERETIQAFGGLASSCENFMKEIEMTRSRMEREIKLRNRREGGQYKNRK